MNTRISNQNHGSTTLGNAWITFYHRPPAFATKSIRDPNLGATVILLGRTVTQTSIRERSRHANESLIR
jgi:hypothetical protein